MLPPAENGEYSHEPPPGRYRAILETLDACTASSGKNGSGFMGRGKCRPDDGVRLRAVRGDRAGLRGWISGLIPFSDPPEPDVQHSAVRGLATADGGPAMVERRAGFDTG